MKPTHSRRVATDSWNGTSRRRIPEIDGVSGSLSEQDVTPPSSHRYAANENPQPPDGERGGCESEQKASDHGQKIKRVKKFNGLFFAPAWLQVYENKGWEKEQTQNKPKMTRKIASRLRFILLKTKEKTTKPKQTQEKLRLSVSY